MQVHIEDAMNTEAGFKKIRTGFCQAAYPVANVYLLSMIQKYQKDENLY